MARITITPLAWTYIGLLIAWTLLLTGAMAFLLRHRRLPCLSQRRLPLVFSAVILLHLYGISCMPGVLLLTLIPCDAQYWVMSIYLPFGMALLQASNSQFQSVATQQRRFARFDGLEDRSLEEKSPLSWWRRILQRRDETDKVLFGIGVGMAVQLALSAFVYFGSEMFHPSYGFFHINVPSEEVRKVQCFVGWEWWLSIVWQFFWAWIYAPYNLWKTRHVHDTHGWRIQTIGCCVAGLFPSPLWLVALHVPEMAVVNASFVPPQWFALSIFLTQIFVIGVPCWQVIKTHNLRHETLEAIEKWEKRHGMCDDSDAPTSSIGGFSGPTLGRTSFISSRGAKSTASTAATTDSRDSTLTMGALEHMLRTNPRPLLEFAALRDFSGENVSFLTHVGDWKRAWRHSNPNPLWAREQYMRAVRIYSHFVSMDYSDFPVNLSSRTAKVLHDVLGDAAHLLNRRRQPSPEMAFVRGGGGGGGGSDSDDTRGSNESSTSDLARGTGGGDSLSTTLGKANLHSVTRMAELSTDNYPGVWSIPDNFTPRVFDAAENEIKYLVLTNTWPKFVHAGSENVTQSPSRDESCRFPYTKKFICGAGNV